MNDKTPSLSWASLTNGSDAKKTEAASRHLEDGRVLFEQKKYSLAIGQFQKAIAGGCVNKEVYKDLGLAFSNIGQHDLAIDALTKAFSLGLDDIDVNIELGRIFREKGDYEASVKSLENAMKFIPKGQEVFLENRLLNEIEISQKKVMLDSKPLGLWVTLTTKCNLKCIMCDVWKEPWDLPDSVIDDIYGFFPYLKEVYWQGGEVFFSEKFQELFDKASSYPNLKQNINTNGILIDKGWAKRLSRRNVSITFAIDGVSRDTYESIRRGAKFRRLAANLEALNKHKSAHNAHAGPSDRMVTIMRFIVMKSNYRQINEAVDFARNFGFDSLQLCPIEGTVTPENIFLHPDRDILDSIKSLSEEALEKSRACGFTLDVNLPLEEPAGEPGKAGKKSLQPQNYGCQAAKANGLACELPWQCLFIGRKGFVMPSCMCIKETGNIHKNSLKEIWNSADTQFYRRSLLEGQAWKACSRLPREIDSRFELIKFNYSQSTSELDIGAIKEILNNNPDISEAYILLAREYLKQDKTDLAIDEFKKAIEKCPGNAEAHFELGRVQRQLRDFESAVSQFKAAIELDADNGEIYLELGAVLREKQELPQAQDALNKALGLNHGDWRVHFELGRVHREMRDFESAVSRLTAAAEFYPDNSEIFLELGMVYREKEDFPRAEAALSKALGLNADDGRIHLELGRLYQREARHAEAIEKLRRYLDSQPYDAKAHLELGRIYLRINNPDSALTELKRAQALGLNNFELYLELGRIYACQGNFDQSVAEFKKARELDPANIMVKGELERVLKDRGEGKGRWMK